MTPEAIAGTISSSMFAVGNIPMLLKATRTRSLSSYSQVQLAMVGTADVIHWFYISSLPFGPIWFLHGFHSVATVMMIGLYLRYEVGARLSAGGLRAGLKVGGQSAVRWGLRGALAGLVLLVSVPLQARPGVLRTTDEAGWTSPASAMNRPWLSAPDRRCGGRWRFVGGRPRLSCGSRGQRR